MTHTSDYFVIFLQWSVSLTFYGFPIIDYDKGLIYVLSNDFMLVPF